MYRKRHVGIGAVNRTGRRKNQVFNIGVPASFENVQESHNIGIYIRVGVFQRIPNPCLGRQVHNRIKAPFGKERFHGRSIGQVDVYVRERGVRGQLVEACLLQVRVIVVVEIVETDDSETLVQEFPGEVKADEASGAGD